MKLLKKTLVVFLAFCMVFGLVACARKAENAAMDDAAESRSDYPADIAPMVDGYYSKEAASLAMTEGSGSYAPTAGDPGDGFVDYGEVVYDDDYDDVDVPVEPTPEAKAGLITASAWNENENYEFWKSLFVSGQTKEDSGKFYDFYKNHNWGFDSTERVTVTVKNGETPVNGAAVVCTDAEGMPLFAARTGADGVAYLFPEASEGKILVSSGEFVAETIFDAENSEITIDLEGAEEQEDLIQIMLVIDVTGSMGDELSYLQSELADVVERIVETNQNTKIELALLFYADDTDGDQKLTYYDFVNVNDEEGLKGQVANILSQELADGGDYQEAVDEALQLAMEKSWSDSASTKIIFHVLDAPPHSNRKGTQNQYEQRFEAAVRDAAEQGVRICPILCSGADSICEYVMRQASIYTGGTTIFVTDHSGIGGSHLDPNIPDMVVETLNDLMVRLINGYHTGVFAEPVEWKPATQPTQYQQ